MAGLDSGIKLHKTASDAIAGLEKAGAQQYSFIILQIEIPKGEKLEKVVFKEGSSKSECQQLVDSDPEKYKLCGDESPTWCVYRTHLATYPCAYGAAYIHYQTDQRNTDKLMFMIWISDAAKTKQRMKYASTKASTMKKFGTTPIAVQASDKDSITFVEIAGGKLNWK